MPWPRRGNAGGPGADGQHHQQQGRGRHGRQAFAWPHAAAAGREDTLAAAEAGRGQQEQHHPAYKDDAPMTPVVYLVLWTSVAVGALNGYVMQGSIAARQSSAYTSTFSRSLPGQALNATPASSPYCATGVDGLPGVSWYETLISVLPPMVAPVLGAIYVRQHGRTHAIMLGCVLMIVGLILLASALHVVQLYIAYAVAHAASDLLYLGVLIQCVEVAPRASRGVFLLVHILGQSLGACLVAVIGYVVASGSTLGWRLLLGMGVIPALAVLLVMPWMVDTPQSFIERGEYAKGWSALRDMRGPFYEDTYGEYMSIVAAAAVAPKGFGMYRELFCRRRYLPALCVGLLIAGLSAQLDPHSRSYVAYNTLVKYGTPLRMAALMTTLTQTLAYALGTIVCILLVDRVGRLPLLRVSSLLAIAISAVLVVASTVYAQEHNISLRSTDMGPREWPMLQLGALCVLSAGNGLAWASAVWVIIAEAQALPVRPAAVALCLASSNLSSSVVEIHLLCLLKVYYYVFVLGVSFLALALACTLVPETARVPLECITDLYAQHWVWRHVVHSRQQQQQQHGGGGKGAAGSDGGGAAPAAGDGSAAAAAAHDALQGHLPRVAGSPFAGAAAALEALPPAAAAAAAGALGPLHHNPHGGASLSSAASPFGHKDVQLAEVVSGALAAAGRGSGDDDDAGRAAAVAAVAAATASAAAVALSIERSGAADAAALLQQQQQRERGLSGGGGSLGSGRLLLGRARTSRGSGGWLSSRLRSSMLPHGDDAGGAAGLDGVVEQLAEELRHEGG